MKKKHILLIVSIIILFVGGFFLIKLLYKGKKIQPLKNFAQLTPPPTLPLVKISSDTTSQKISFPSYNISFRVPKELQTIKQLVPNSEDTQIGANFIALYTADSLIDPKKHTQTSGAKISIHVVDTKKDFSDKQEIIPTTSMQQTKEDTSVIPANNAFLTKKTMQVYSFPVETSASTSAWSYNAEGLIRNGGNMLDITLYCIDYSAHTNTSPTCQKLLKDILPTMQR